MLYHRLLSKSLFVFATLVLAQVSHAQTLTVVEELDFGQAVVTDNSSQYSVNIQANGNYSADSVFIFLQVPSEGVYQFDGLPVSTAISNISITVDQQMIGPGEDFIIDNFDIDAPSSTSPIGELEVRLGARMRTTGSSQQYLHNSDYDSVLTITITY